MRPFHCSAFLKVAGMHDGAGEFGEAGQIRRIRNAAHAGREDQMARVHDALAAVGAAQRDVPLPALVVVAAADKRGAGPEIQLQRLDIRFEPVRQLVLRDIDRQGRRERHIGQVIDVHFVVQRQRMVALAPVVADALMPVDDQRVDAELMQPRGDRQSGLAAADHEHRRIAVGIGALAGETVEPVVGAEIARCDCPVRARRLNASSWPRSSCRVRVQRPGAQARALRVGHQAHARRCRGRTRCRIRTIASMHSVPARVTQRGGVRLGGIWKFTGFVRASVSRSIARSRPAGHGLDGPGEGQHVAPEPVGQETVRPPPPRPAHCKAAAKPRARLPRRPAASDGAILDQGHERILRHARRRHQGWRG